MEWLRRSLTGKFFLSYLLVISVGVVTLILAITVVAPPLIDYHMGMMTGGMGMMGRGNGAFTAHVQAAVRDALIQALLLATGMATLVALGVSLVVTRQITGPIRHMARATRRIAAGHYAERVAIPAANTGDDLGTLAASFNAMAQSLEETERRRLALVGDVAHELRTPIATIEGYLEGLLDGMVAPSPALWATLHNEAGRLRRLANDLQDLARAEAHQIPLSPRPTAPAALIQAALDRLADQFSEKGLTLETSVPSTLPHVQVDPDRAVQVLTNLLTNALRYTPAPGQVTVHGEARGPVVAVSVADTGVGIAADHLPHLFERFYRVDRSRSRALGGSGIGLTIAKALVEVMEGQITVQSAGLGRGSTVTVTFPVAPSVTS